GEQPPALLDAQRVLGAAALEDVVSPRVERIGHEAVCKRASTIAGDGIAPVIASNGRIVEGVAVELKQPGWKWIAIARPDISKEIRGDDGIDDDADRRSGRQTGFGGGEEVTGADGC